jgi:hypothetical protein
MNDTVIFCLVFAELGFALGYFLGWCWEQINDLTEAYIEGMCSLERAAFWTCSPEVWR